MGIMFWLWMGFWALGWIILFIIHFVTQSKNNSDEK